MKVQIYLQYGGMDEEFMARNIENIGKRRGVETQVLINKDLDLLGARGVDLFLLHCSEIPSETIKLLRKNNPKSLIYGIFGGAYGLDKKFLEESYQRTYDKVYGVGGIAKDQWNEIFQVFKQSEETR